MITCDRDRVCVDTTTLTAEIRRGHLVSLRRKADGKEFVVPATTEERSALQLVYRGGETVDIGGEHAVSITCHRLSPHRVDIRCEAWDGLGVIRVSEDPATGDLLIEPSAYSSRPGLLACRWILGGIRDDLELVAPFFQGVKLKLEDPLVAGTHWPWPKMWEAGLCILQGADGGFWAHTEDVSYRYKALLVGGKNGPRSLGFDAEAYGPIDNNLAAGGLAWRINVHQGDWRVPAARYRDWLWHAYGLASAAAGRAEWIPEIRLALTWCPSDPALLDALARRIEPGKVLIHCSNWRTDGYDQNYPTFTPSEPAKEFFAKANALGFHAMPHCNAVDMDPTHPVYPYVQDFTYRDAQTKRRDGWGWDRSTSTQLGVPESPVELLRNQRKLVMVKIHPGLSMWRSLLEEQIFVAVDALKVDTVFTDVTLCVQNLHQCLVENLSPAEGMKSLIADIASLQDGLVVAGEGLNEITMQGLSFAQAHLFYSWHRNVAGVERTGGCPLNAFLFDKLCRTTGYGNISGAAEDQQLRMHLHVRNGAIPTISVGSAGEIDEPNAGVQAMLALATE